MLPSGCSGSATGAPWDDRGRRIDRESGSNFEGDAARCAATGACATRDSGSVKVPTRIQNQISLRVSSVSFVKVMQIAIHPTITGASQLEHRPNTISSRIGSAQQITLTV